MKQFISFQSSILTLIFLLSGVVGFTQTGGSLDAFYNGFNYQPKQTLGVSAGIAWKDTEGDSQTTFCVGGEYLHRLNNPQERGDSGFYLGGFADYKFGTSDMVDRSILKVGAKTQFHCPVNEAADLQLISGVKTGYKFGTIEDSGSKDDVSGYFGSLYSGLNYRVNNKWSVGLEVPIVNYSHTTFEQQDGDFEYSEDKFSIAVNKRNPLMLVARFNLGNNAAEK